MVRPRKIPRDFIPPQWSETDEESELEVPVPPLINHAENQENMENNDLIDTTDISSDDDIDIPTYQDFSKMLKSVAKDWLLLEISHNVSKTASDAFWEVAKKLLHGLVEEQLKSKKKKKIPTFTHIRRLLVVQHCPDIKLNLGYKRKDNGEMVILDDLRKIPVTQYNRGGYEPMYEIASLQVSQNIQRR